MQAHTLEQQQQPWHNPRRETTLSFNGQQAPGSQERPRVWMRAPLISQAERPASSVNGRSTSTVCFGHFQWPELLAPKTQTPSLLCAQALTTLKSPVLLTQATLSGTVCTTQRGSSTLSSLVNRGELRLGFSKKNRGSAVEQGRPWTSPPQALWWPGVPRNVGGLR